MFGLERHFSVGEHAQPQFFVDDVNLFVRRVLVFVFTALERLEVGFEYV